MGGSLWLDGLDEKKEITILSWTESPPNSILTFACRLVISGKCRGKILSLKAQTRRPIDFS